MQMAAMQIDEFQFVRNRNFEVYGEEKNMIFHYAGKYNGDESNLNHRHPTYSTL